MLNLKSKDNDKMAKKRGRPKKSMEQPENKNIVDIQSFYSKNKHKEEPENDDIFLFLPGVKTSHITDNIYQKDTEKKNEIFNMDDFDISSDSDDEKLSKSMTEKMTEYEKIISTLESEIEKYKKIIEDSNYVQEHIKSIAKLIDLNLFDYSTGKKLLVEKTEIVCWWCTYNFDNVPCVIPIKYYNDKYYVFGNFCTFNCACSYNLKMDDYKKHDRHALLCKLYVQIFQTTRDLVPAPDKEILLKYGGNVTIEEYRNSSIKNDISYRFIMPPMKAICPIVECINKNNYPKNDTELVVKRTKPLPHAKNTFKNQFSF